MNVSLPQDLMEYVDAQTKAGYSARPNPRQSEAARLDTLFLDGLNSGDPVAATPEFWADRSVPQHFPVPL